MVLKNGRQVAGTWDSLKPFGPRHIVTLLTFLVKGKTVNATVLLFTWCSISYVPKYEVSPSSIHLVCLTVFASYSLSGRTEGGWEPCPRLQGPGHLLCLGHSWHFPTSSPEGLTAFLPTHEWLHAYLSRLCHRGPCERRATGCRPWTPSSQPGVWSGAST